MGAKKTGCSEQKHGLEGEGTEGTRIAPERWEEQVHNLDTSSFLHTPGQQTLARENIPCIHLKYTWTSTWITLPQWIWKMTFRWFSDGIIYQWASPQCICTLKNWLATEKFSFCIWKNCHSWPLAFFFFWNQNTWTGPNFTLNGNMYKIGGSFYGAFSKGIFSRKQHSNRYFLYYKPWQKRLVTTCHAYWRSSFCDVGRSFWWPGRLRKENIWRLSTWKSVSLKSSAESHFEKFCKDICQFEDPSSRAHNY